MSMVGSIAAMLACRSRLKSSRTASPTLHSKITRSPPTTPCSCLQRPAHFNKQKPQQNLSEEEKMADWLKQNLRDVTFNTPDCVGRERPPRANAPG